MASVHSYGIRRLAQTMMVMALIVFGGAKAGAQDTCADFFAADAVGLPESTELMVEDREALRLAQAEERARVELEKIRELSLNPGAHRSDVEAMILIRQILDAPMKDLSEWVRNQNNYPTLSLEKVVADRTTQNYKTLAKKLEKIGKWTALKKGLLVRLGSVLPGFRAKRVKALEKKIRSLHYDVREDLTTLDAETLALRRSSEELHDKVETFTDDLEFASVLVRELEAQALNVDGKSAAQQRFDQEMLRQVGLVHKDMMDLFTVSNGVLTRIDQGITYNVEVSREIRSLLEKDMAIITAVSTEAINLAPEKARAERRKSMKERIQAANDRLRPITANIKERVHRARWTIAMVATAAGIVGLANLGPEILNDPAPAAKVDVVETVAQQVQTPTVQAVVLSVEVQDTLKRAKLIENGNARDPFLKSFVSAHGQELTAPEALELANAAYWPSATGNILKNFIEQNAQRLTADEVATLARKIDDGNLRDPALSSYVQAKNTLSVSEVNKLASTAYWTSAGDKIRSSVISARSAELSAGDVVSIAQKIDDGTTRDAALVSYAKANKARLSSDDLIALGKASYWSSNRDTILSVK